MDAFYASVEQRDDPSLRGLPVVVGVPPRPGLPNRGVVLAASYEVRPLGVRSAMPMARAVELAPHAVVVAPRFHAYQEASERVFAILSSVTPLVQPLSLDEAFLDVTASQALFGSPGQMARHLRQRIEDEVGLPSSAGIAPVMFAAKIASDVAKPRGQREVTPEGLLAFLHPLPVGRLWGVGPRTEEHLASLGLRTVGDLADRPADWLEERLGVSGRHLWALSHGVDTREVVPDHDAKSVGAEDTFETDLLGLEPLRPLVHGQALRVGRRLRQAGLRGRAVQLKVKFADFRVITRRSVLPSPTDDGQELYRAAMALLARVDLRRKVRLTGVSAQDLVDGGGQLSLLEHPDERPARLNAALDTIAARFGDDAVTTADLRQAEGAGGSRPLRGDRRR
jgi:DNA polymerase-4